MTVRGLLMVFCPLICICTILWLHREPSQRFTGISKIDPIDIPFGRENDFTEIFSTFKGYKECGFGSVDLHKPLPNLCTTRQALFNAMSDGRRASFNAPFEPLGCDLHFFSTSEICTLLDRFEAVIFFGDSLMRQTEWNIAMLLQENYYDGGQSSWVEIHDPDPLEPCVCEHQAFSWQCVKGETSIELLYENTPEKILCANRPKTIFRYELAWPLNQTDLERLMSEVLAPTRPAKPYAFILGHAGWNDVNATATLGWVDQIMSTLPVVRPYLTASPENPMPVAFVSQSAAGPEKPAKWIATQGNVAVPKFQALIREPILEKGIDFLSPFNMSLNASIPDGTHVGIRINLLKAMTLINWLNMLDVSRWSNVAP